MEVNEPVENTSDHSEQSGNAQTSDKSKEIPKEREENETATGIHTIYIVLLKLDDDKNFVLQCMFSNIAKEISKHVPAKDLDYPTL